MAVAFILGLYLAVIIMLEAYVINRDMKEKEGRKMKNRKLCEDCKYSGTIGSRTKRSEDTICEFSLCAQKGTCLIVHNGEVIDRRGYDPEVCLLKEKGEALGRQAMVIRRAKNGKTKS